MRRIHIYLSKIEENNFKGISVEFVRKLLSELETTVRNEFYPSVPQPFRPFLHIKSIESADIAIFFLSQQENTEFKENYYKAYVREIPIFIIALSEAGGDSRFRKELFARYPHFIFKDDVATLLKLKEYLSEFFLRELQHLVLPQYSQVQPASLEKGYKRDWEVFIKPPIYSKAKDILFNEHFLILQGALHHGKSTLARNLLYEYKKRGYQINEILSPIFGPQIFIKILKQPQPIITLFDTDAFPDEWTWSISKGVLRMTLATIEKWSDKKHPVIMVFSNKKLLLLLREILKTNWSSLKKITLSIPSFNLNKKEIKTVVKTHLKYYKIHPIHHDKVLLYFESIMLSQITPSLIFYTLRFALFPQGPDYLNKLKKNKQNLFTPQRLFRHYLQFATLRELLFYYLILATEMEIDFDTLQQLTRRLYHYNLFMDGTITELSPHKQKWINNLLIDLDGAVIRRYFYDEEERIVFANEIFRKVISKNFKLHSKKRKNRVLGEAIVEFLVKEPYPNGKFFAIRFLFDHYQAFDEKFKKRILYSLFRDPDKEVRAFLAKNLHRISFLIGKDGLALLYYLFKDKDEKVRALNAEFLGLQFTHLTTMREKLFKLVKKDKSIKVRKAFSEAFSLNQTENSELVKKIYFELAQDNSEEIKAGLILGLITNYQHLPAELQTLTFKLLQRREETIVKQATRAFIYLPYFLLRTTFLQTLIEFQYNESGFVRSMIPRALGGKLKLFPAGIQEIINKLSNDDSPLVRKETALCIIKNFDANQKDFFGILHKMVLEQKPFLRAAISSVIIEYFSAFSPEQQATFLQHFLQQESVEGVRKSLSELIGSHFNLIKSDTEDLYFKLITHINPQIRANMAEQILRYYDRLQPKTQLLLNNLVRDRSGIVRRTIASNLAEQCQKIVYQHFIYLFSRLIEDKNEFVRAALALKMPLFKPAMTAFDFKSNMSKLISDTTLVRSNLAKSLLCHYDKSEELIDTYLNHLMKDLSIQVRKTILKSLLECYSKLSEDIICNVLKTFSMDSCRELRLSTYKTIIELFPNLSEKMLKKLLPLLSELDIVTDKRVNKELEMAADIQRNLIPRRLPRVDGFGFSFMFAPARVIGGDYLGFFPIAHNKVGIAMADISGKGIPAALLMANLQAWLKAQVNIDPNPVGVTERLNEAFRESTHGEKFVSLVYGILNNDTAEFDYVNAGHNYPILLKKDSSYISLNVGGPIMGVFSNIHYQNQIITMEKGSRLVLYTDGVTESRDEKGNEFGEERLIKIFQQHPLYKPKQMVDEIERQIINFSGLTVQYDDISLLVTQRY